jgi:hypothetical protein
LPLSATKRALSKVPSRARTARVRQLPPRPVAQSAMGFARENQVRTGLRAGGTRIRTIGPSRGLSPIRAVGAETNVGRRKRPILYGGTGGSNPGPSTGESVANRFLPRGEPNGRRRPVGANYATISGFGNSVTFETQRFCSTQRPTLANNAFFVSPGIVFEGVERIACPASEVGSLALPICTREKCPDDHAQQALAIAA